jgi:hypothetical protein
VLRVRDARRRFGALKDVDLLGFWLKNFFIFSLGGLRAERYFPAPAVRRLCKAGWIA